MRPQDVKPGNFNVKEILYDDKDFAIAFGKWKPNGKIYLAMRWNGETDNNVGYPKVFRHPMWFLVTSNVASSFLHGLLGNKYLRDGDYEKILAALAELPKA